MKIKINMKYGGNGENEKKYFTGMFENPKDSENLKVGETYEIIKQEDYIKNLNMVKMAMNGIYGLRSGGKTLLQELYLCNQYMSMISPAMIQKAIAIDLASGGDKTKELAEKIVKDTVSSLKYNDCPIFKKLMDMNDEAHKKHAKDELDAIATFMEIKTNPITTMKFVTPSKRRVMFNGVATILEVNGEKIIVKCDSRDNFSPITGFKNAIYKYYKKVISTQDTSIAKQFNYLDKEVYSEYTEEIKDWTLAAFSGFDEIQNRRIMKKISKYIKRTVTDGEWIEL